MRKARKEFRFVFDIDPELPSMESDMIEAIAEGYVRANEMAIAYDPDRFPCCLNCGKLRYMPPPTCTDKNGRPLLSCQPVLGAGPLMDEGMETCLGLACLLAAIKRNKGDRAASVKIEPRMSRYGVVPGKWHAVVVDGHGAVHDPQQILGPKKEPEVCINCKNGGVHVHEHTH